MNPKVIMITTFNKEGSVSVFKIILFMITVEILQESIGIYMMHAQQKESIHNIL